MQAIGLRTGTCSMLAAAYLSALAGGCGLLGIELFPEPEVHSAQFYTVTFFCDSDENGDLVRATRVILHNSEGGPVTVFGRVAGVGMDSNTIEPSWSQQVLDGGRSARLDCDAFARMLTGNPTTSFKNEFEAGTRVQGVLTLGIESGSDVPILDAAAQYDEPDGSLRIEPLVPSLIVVRSWPPSSD